MPFDTFFIIGVIGLIGMLITCFILDNEEGKKPVNKKKLNRLIAAEVVCGALWLGGWAAASIESFGEDAAAVLLAVAPIILLIMTMLSAIQCVSMKPDDPKLKRTMVMAVILCIVTIILFEVSMYYLGEIRNVR